MNTGLLDKPKSRAPSQTLGGQRSEPDRPAGEKKQSLASKQIRLPWQNRIGQAELVALCQHLAALSGSGVSLAECLRTFMQETPSPVTREVIGEVIDDLEAGKRLSDALGRHPDQFSAYFQASIWAGETSGRMAETLDRMARYLEDRQETRHRVRNAFAYPVVLSVVIVSVVVFLMMYVVPVFATVYGRMGIPLPGPTQFLISVSETLTSQPWILAGPVALLTGLVLWVKRTDAGRLWMDRHKSRIPILGKLFHQVTLHRFIRCFADMMGAGVPVLEGLDVAGNVAGNTAFDQDLETVRAEVQKGQGLTEPLRRTGWFTPSLLQVISTGEQSGRVSELLARSADILKRDLDMTLKRVVGKVEPLLTVAMAGVVGLVLMAVYLPMFDVMQHVGQ